MRRSRWLSLIALLAVFGMLAAACGDDDDGDTTPADDTSDDTSDDTADGDIMSMDFSGQTINILTPETASEADGFLASLDPFLAATGLEVNLNSTRDATTELNLALEAGDPPDVVIVPQPGRTQVFCEDGSAIPVPQSALDRFAGEYDANWFEIASSSDGTVCGLPIKGDVKGIVWYNIDIFETGGYEIPTTFDDFDALVDQMIADGIAPLCVAMESSDATGWVYTDWVENMVLRVQGPDVYDQWVAHEIPFNGPEITEVVELIDDLWFRDGAIFGGTDQIATTNFRDAAIPLVAGDCAMVQQASFYGAPITENGGVVGADGTHDAFKLPLTTDEFGEVQLTAGTHAVAFTDTPASHATVEWLATSEAANARIVAQGSGYLSANLAHDTSLYTNDLEKFFVELLVGADVARYDGGDLMPGEIGSGSFWREPTDYVSGAQTLTEMLDNIEEDWNALG
jgi:alpha-glucoside transport system substrate-binding protein